MSKGAQIAVGASVIALLLGWYGYTNLEAGSTFRYYQTLAEFRDADIEPGASLRVHGYVSEGTIERRVDARQVHFAVQNAAPHAGGPVGATLRVVYASLETPDLFKDGAEVVVEGSMRGRGPDAVFMASNVLAKCPSKFEAEIKVEGARSAQL